MRFGEIRPSSWSDRYRTAIYGPMRRARMKDTEPVEFPAAGNPCAPGAPVRQEDVK